MVYYIYRLDQKQSKASTRWVIFLHVPCTNNNRPVPMTFSENCFLYTKANHHFATNLFNWAEDQRQINTKFFFYSMLLYYKYYLLKYMMRMDWIGQDRVYSCCFRSPFLPFCHFVRRTTPHWGEDPTVYYLLIHTAQHKHNGRCIASSIIIIEWEYAFGSAVVSPPPHLHHQFDIAWALN